MAKPPRPTFTAAAAAAGEDFDPSKHKLGKTQAQRLAAVSGLDAAQLAGLTVTEIGERFRFRIDPLLLLFRKVCGRVVKTDPGTGTQYPVPFATVQVEDTDASFLGYFPSGHKWAWYFPFASRREVIASTRTDACGNFCVWVPRWDIDWILRWRHERLCFPIVFERPSLKDLLDDLLPQRVPVRFPPIPEPDPAPFDFTSLDRNRLVSALGNRAAQRVQQLQSRLGFGASTREFQDALAAPAHAAELAPPLPAELKQALAGTTADPQAAKSAKAAVALQASAGLANRLRLDAVEFKGLDLRRYIGPFKRCIDVFVPEWTPIVDVPDITFRVTQDTNGDGVEEVIYGEGWFQVRWNATALPTDLTIEARPNARAGLPCGPDAIPCGNVPAIVMAGMLPVAAVPTLYDATAGYSVRTNRPHPSGLFNDPLPNPDAAAPLYGVLALYGCRHTDRTATRYRMVYEYSADQGATFTAKTPFLGLTWPMFRLDGGGNPEWHYPTPDADGWYPIDLPAGPNPFQHEQLLLDWPSGAYPDGRYRVTLQLGTGGTAVSSESAPVAFTVDNTAPTGPLAAEWSFSASGPWQPIGGACPVVRRGSSPATVYFRVTLAAASGHLRSARLWANSCGAGSFAFISGSGGAQSPSDPLVYEHWHTSVADNDQLLQVVYQLPSTAAEGTYGFGANVSSRAFNPAGGDGGQLAVPTWQYDPADIHIQPSMAFSVINAA